MTLDIRSAPPARGTRDARRASRRRSVPRFLAAVTLAAGLLAVDVLRGSEGAWAVDYPTWDDVVAARSSEAAKKAEVECIQGIIGQLQAEVEAAQALALQKADEYSAAQDAYDTAAFRADELAVQAAEATERAELTNQQAGRLITQFTRAGGGDLTLNLIVAGEQTDDLLYQLGAMSQLSQQTGRLYDQAAQDRNTATALTDQAQIARTEREALRIAAEAAFEEAVAAQERVEAALVEQEAQGIVLEEQLKVLNAATATTEVEYQKGVEERRRAEEAARAAAAAAAA
ncbi:MAG: M23 family peptidase, partial [Herbiconiux sp.]|nr:M23 family peptidase [Herbiconiux sp.]